MVGVRDDTCWNSSFMLIFFEEQFLVVNFMRHNEHIEVIIGLLHQILPVSVVLIIFMP